MDGWVDDLQFYILFNSISVVSETWEGDNEMLCAMETSLRFKRFMPPKTELRTVRLASQPLTH